MMILSVDGGATKTCAILYDDERKRFVSSGIAGPSHFVSVSPDVSEKNIREAVNEALLEGDENIDNVDSVILGVAGAGDSIETTERGEKIVQRVLGRKKFVLNNDGYVAYRMSNLFQDGVMFAPGTGSVGFYQKSGKLKRIAGWGWFAGDEGSASWIAKRAITLAERQKDGLIPGDTFVRLIEEYFSDNFKEAIGHLEIVHDKRKVSLLAPRVSQLASNGNELALSIISEAGEYVGNAINACLNNFDKCPEVSVVGGTVQAGEHFKNAIEKASKCRPRFFPGYDVCVGGIMIVSNTLGNNISAEERDKIVTELEHDIMKKPKERLRDSLGVI